MRLSIISAMEEEEGRWTFYNFELFEFCAIRMLSRFKKYVYFYTILSKKE